MNNKAPVFRRKIWEEILFSGMERKLRTLPCRRTYVMIKASCPRFTQAPGDDQEDDCVAGVEIISFEDCSSQPGGGGFYDPKGEISLPIGGAGGSGVTILNGLDAHNMAEILVKYFLDIPPFDPNAPAFID